MFVLFQIQVPTLWISFLSTRRIFPTTFWLSQNQVMFEDFYPTFTHCTMHSLDILAAFPQQKLFIIKTPHLDHRIQKESPWDFLTEQYKSPFSAGTRGIIFFSKDISISFSTSLGPTTNNFNELMALNVTLNLEREIGMSKLHIYGDSLISIN